MKNKILSMLLSVTMLSSMAVMSVNADETTSVNDVYNITFNNGTVSEPTSNPDGDTMLAWVSGEGYTRGFSLSGTKSAGTSWSLQADPAPAADETDDKAIKVISTPSANTTNLYMSINTAGFNSSYNDKAKIVCGENGYTEIAFDFYSDFRTNIRLSAGRFWDQSGNEINANTNLLYIYPNGKILLQGAEVKTVDVEEYKNTWHNIKFVFKADNTYRAFLDDEPLIDWTTLSFDEGVLIGGIKELRLYNICTAGETSTKYYDNLRYSFSTSPYTEPTEEPTSPPIPLTHSDNSVNRNFAVSEGYLFVDPNMTVEAFKAGLNKTGDVLDAQGIALADDAAMATAASFKVTDAEEEYAVVPTINSVQNDTGSIEVAENSAINCEWVYSSDYYNKRGYKAEIVDAFEGKESGDKSLKITLETLTDASSSAAFLDFYPADEEATAYTETSAPITYAYSIYTHQEGEGGNSLQARLDGSTYANGVFETDSWNRYAVTVYPNSKEYKFYINGVLAGEGELNASLPETEKKRFRFRFQTATAGNYFVIDDVETIYGVYEPECDVVLTENGADLTATAVTSSNNNADFVNTMLVIAEYDENGVLINKTVDKGTATPSEVSATLSNVQDKTMVKVFFWRMSDIKPIKEVKTFD